MQKNFIFREICGTAENNLYCYISFVPIYQKAYSFYLTQFYELESIKLIWTSSLFFSNIILTPYLYLYPYIQFSLLLFRLQESFSFSIPKKFFIFFISSTIYCSYVSSFHIHLSLFHHVLNSATKVLWSLVPLLCRIISGYAPLGRDVNIFSLSIF